jgi:SAM-dependent methyltransferase
MDKIPRPETGATHDSTTASGWIARFAAAVPPGPVLDLACGAGRHLRYFRAAAHPVTGLDRDLSGVRDLAGADGVELIEADLEAGAAWPLGGRQFMAVVVTNYLWRPLLPAIVGAVAPSGWLLYETFAQGNEQYGRPRNPDFLLRPGELLAAVEGRLAVVAYEHGRIEQPRTAVIQRIAARASTDPAESVIEPARNML